MPNEENVPEVIRLCDWTNWFLSNVNDPKDYRWVHMRKQADELLRLHNEVERLQAIINKSNKT